MLVIFVVNGEEVSAGWCCSILTHVSYQILRWRLGRVLAPQLYYSLISLLQRVEPQPRRGFFRVMAVKLIAQVVQALLHHKLHRLNNFLWVAPVTHSWQEPISKGILRTLLSLGPGVVQIDHIQLFKRVEKLLHDISQVLVLLDTDFFFFSHPRLDCVQPRIVKSHRL